MVRKFWYLFLALLIEGSALMAVELMGAKLLAPFYGSSLYVWTAVLCITVLGLTLGYYSGGKLSSRYSSEKLLVGILGISAVLVFTMPATAGIVIRLTSAMTIIPGICLASLLLLAPPMFCFGHVGPVVVRLMANKMETLGNVAGTVYFTSTMGGILATFGFGFYWIPEFGLTFSADATAIALALLPIIYLLKSYLPQTQYPSSPIQNSKFPVQNSKPRAPKLKPEIQKSVYLYAALEGATVMAVELLAARMLAPYFGSSLYVWATVIGITLLSLALGYFVGGRLADKYAQINVIHWVVLSAAVFLVLMHASSQWLTVAFMDWDMRISVVLVSLLMIVPSLLFLGMVPTLVIRYLTNHVERAGAITGRVFSISSASGIAVLPVIGFFVIPAFGLTVPSIAIGLLVGAVPLIKLLGQKKYLSLFFALFILLTFSKRTVNGPSPDLKVLSYSEGLLGQLLVADLFKNGLGAPTDDRMLFINRMGQTNINKTTNTSKWNYITFITALASKLPENSDALVLGLGGGSASNIFRTNLKFRVDAVELDERIGEVARKYFQLNPEVKVIVDDARHYIETTKKAYDLIFFDLFKGESQPPHVLTVESFKRAKSLLNKGGFIIVNFHGFLSDEVGRPGRSVYATLEASGLDTRILTTPGKEEDRNTLFIATLGKQGFQQVRYPLLHLGQPVDLESLFLDPMTLNLKSSVVFTDDKPDLDRMNLEANSIWRKSYNATYSKFILESGVPMFK